jgi:hypothetical protein
MVTNSHIEPKLAMLSGMLATRGIMPRCRQVLSCALFGRSDVDCTNVFNVKDASPHKIVPTLPEHELPV